MSAELVLVVLVVRFPIWLWRLPFTLPLNFLEMSRLASGHRLRSLHFQLTRSDSLQIFGKNNTIATRLLEERHCWGMHPNCKLFPRKIGATFIITVYVTASANAVPEARSHSPTSSSQALKPDSKPSAWSHQSFTGIVIFCISAYCQFCVSGACLPCIRRHASAPLDSSTDRTRVRVLPFVIKASEE